MPHLSSTQAPCQSPYTAVLLRYPTHCAASDLAVHCCNTDPVPASTCMQAGDSAAIEQEQTLAADGRCIESNSQGVQQRRTDRIMDPPFIWGYAEKDMCGSIENFQCLTTASTTAMTT